MTNVFLLMAVALVESSGNPRAVNKAEQAYGLHQTRQAALDDVNRANGTSFTLEDCLDPGVSSFVFWRYGILYKAKNAEEHARMWNGGPRGHMKRGTLDYWERVSGIMNALAAEGESSVWRSRS